MKNKLNYEKYIMDYNLVREFINACYTGNLDLVKSLAEKNSDVYAYGVSAACEGGHLNIVELLIDKVNDLKWALHGACAGGHTHIINLLISRGCNNWYYGLAGACSKKRKDIALLMIIKGADINGCQLMLDFDDIYYLLQSGVTKFRVYSYVADDCKKFKQEFKNVVNELFIKDVANLITEY